MVQQVRKNIDMLHNGQMSPNVNLGGNKKAEGQCPFKPEVSPEKPSWLGTRLLIGYNSKGVRSS